MPPEHVTYLGCAKATLHSVLARHKHNVCKWDQVVCNATVRLLNLYRQKRQAQLAQPPPPDIAWHTAPVGALLACSATTGFAVIGARWQQQLARSAQQPHDGTRFGDVAPLKVDAAWGTPPARTRTTTNLCQWRVSVATHAIQKQRLRTTAKGAAPRPRQSAPCRHR